MCHYFFTFADCRGLNQALEVAVVDFSKLYMEI